MSVQQFWKTNQKVTDSNRQEQIYSFMSKRLDAKKRSREDSNFDPTTLHIPDSALNNMTNMERQFWEIKRQYFDVVIFFKKGKFYELYDVDAELAQREFGLKMVADQRGKMRMAGIPEQSFTTWAQQFILRGYRVGRVEQMNAKQADAACVPRELVKVYSPGTLCDVDLIDTANALYMLSVTEEPCANATQDNDMTLGVFTIDASRGKGYYAAFTGPERYAHFGTMLRHISPKEIVVPSTLSSVLSRIIAGMASTAFIQRAPPEETSKVFDADHVLSFMKMNYVQEATPSCLLTLVSQPSVVLAAFGGALYYMQRLKIFNDVVTPHTEFSYFVLDEAVCVKTQYMALDANTLEHLEILQGEKCVLNRIDFTVTPPGKRLIRKWLLEPLRNPEDIISRQDCVKVFSDYPKDFVSSLIRSTIDLERNAVRLKVMVEEKVVSWVDCAAYGKKVVSLLVHTAQHVIKMCEAIEKLIGKVTADKSLHLAKLWAAFPHDLRENLSRFLKSFNTQEAMASGFPIPTTGSFPEYDAINSTVQGIQVELNKYLVAARTYFRDESLEFVDSGKDLFLIELPVGTKVAPPANFNEFGRTSKVVRYRNSQMEPLIKKFKEASDEKNRILQIYLKEILKLFSHHHVDILKCNNVIAEMDVLQSFAIVSNQPGTCRPTIIHDSEAKFNATGLYHPCTTLPPGVVEIVPNDVSLDVVNGRVTILTGPNMGGKSTLMRAVAVATLLAQVGLCVNATQCTLSPVDRIYTRIGAKDNLFQQQSTFFVELNEMAHIMRHATQRSLVLVDELGRGTSTFDGYAVAYGALHFLVKNSKCLSLFATHYYFLALQATTVYAEDNVRAMHMSYAQDPKTKEVILLHKLVPGICSNSYGIEVARKAGIKEHVLRNAQEQSTLFAQRLGIDDQANKIMMMSALAGVLQN